MQTNYIKLNLTPLEWEILQHRMDDPDAVAEAMSPEENDGVGYASSDVVAVIDAIERQDWDSANAGGSGVVSAVLLDLVEGSTYAVSMDDAVAFDEITPQRAGAIRRAGQSLARKVSDATGVRVSFPTA